jgi:cysteine-rich repeat protein
MEVPEVYSSGSLVLHNIANGNMLEGFNLNGTSDTYMVGNRATENSTGTWPGHVSAGIALCVGQLDCQAVSGSGTSNNLLLGNVSTASGGDQDYGVYLGGGVSSNTIRYNDLYPNAVAALEDVSGASNTVDNNRTSSSTTALDTAPPIADAGTGATLSIGQAAILDGSGSYFMSNNATMSYSWAQVYGPTVVLTNTDSVQAGFLAPTVTQLELLGFRLTVDNSNGSTYDEVYFAVLPAPAGTCGNETLDPYEQCDDGNHDEGDGCDSNCTFTACGNGIVTSGEGCDDGNPDDGDCCLSTCQPAPPGTPCDDEDPCTQEDGCSAGVCVGLSQPDPTCQPPGQSGKSSVVLRDRQPDTGDRLGWKWTQGPAATMQDFGDPVDGSTFYKLCVYDEGGPSGASRLILDGWIPPGGSCAGRDCWRRAGTSSFRYKDKTRSSDGMQTLMLKAKTDGSAKIVITGKGAGLAFAVPELGLAAPVTVQLQSTDGTCWEAVYRSPARNRSDFLRAKVVGEP